MHASVASSHADAGACGSSGLSFIIAPKPQQLTLNERRSPVSGSSDQWKRWYNVRLQSGCAQTPPEFRPSPHSGSEPLSVHMLIPIYLILTLNILGIYTRYFPGRYFPICIKPTPPTHFEDSCHKFSQIFINPHKFSQIFTNSRKFS